MKFLVDMPLSPALARWLVERGHDAVHASEVELGRASDVQLIEHARGEARTVITADLDYPRLLALADAAEPGVILFRGGDWNQVDIVARMSALFASLSDDDIERSMVVIERQRIRRRRLPLSK